MTMTIDKKYFDDYDWREAFRAANLNINDVHSFFGKYNGQNGGDNWLCYGRLKSGEHFFLSAWCDYTGWDCRSGCDTYYSYSLEDLIKMRMGDEDRAKLGLESIY